LADGKKERGEVGKYRIWLPRDQLRGNQCIALFKEW
jgi:hypothetical protein